MIPISTKLSSPVNQNQCHSSFYRSKYVKVAWVSLSLLVTSNIGSSAFLHSSYHSQTRPAVFSSLNVLSISDHQHLSLSNHEDDIVNSRKSRFSYLYHKGRRETMPEMTFLNSWLSSFAYCLIPSMASGSLKSNSKGPLIQNEELKRNQHVIDSYIESIDKRYKRLHELDNAPTQGSLTSVWKWVMPAETSSQAVEQRKKDDALYVLDLAEMASVKLLQKHHLLLPKTENTMVKKPNLFSIKFVSIFLSIVSTAISKIIQAARSEITLFNTRAQSFVNIFTKGRKIVSSSTKHITSSLASCCDFSWLRRLTTTLSEKCVACVSALVRVDKDDSIRQHSQSVVRDSNNYTNNRHIIDQSKQCTA